MLTLKENRKEVGGRIGSFLIRKPTQQKQIVHTLKKPNQKKRP
jgi:hypothetical protein